MLAANFCGHCTSAKPDYQAAAKKHPEIFFATIQGDSENPEEQKLSQRLGQMFPDFKGYPTFVGFKNGKFMGTHNGARDGESIVEFAKSL
jgi:thiol-disulfide isomerase/thioredoxin